MPSVCIVGSNRGIGLELVKHYSNRGDTVYALCRKTSEDLNKLKNVVVLEGFDIATDAVIAKVEKCEKLPTKLDVVIVNAGILKMGKFDSLSNTEPFWEMLNINSVGPLRIARGIKSRLQEGSKFGVLTSGLGSMEDNTSGGLYAYRMSKAALNMGAKTLSVDWKKDGIAVAMMNPGFVNTDMAKSANISGGMEPSVSATGLVSVMDKVTMENSGTFWHAPKGTVYKW